MSRWPPEGVRDNRAACTMPRISTAKASSRWLDRVLEQAMREALHFLGDHRRRRRARPCAACPAPDADASRIRASAARRTDSRRRPRARRGPCFRVSSSSGLTQLQRGEVDVVLQFHATLDRRSSRAALSGIAHPSEGPLSVRRSTRQLEVARPIGAGPRRAAPGCRSIRRSGSRPRGLRGDFLNHVHRLRKCSSPPPDCCRAAVEMFWISAGQIVRHLFDLAQRECRRPRPGAHRRPLRRWSAPSS